MLAVGALRPDGLYAAFSNYGTWVDIAAPGHAILAANVDPTLAGPYVLVRDVLAALYVAGVAALIA